MKIFLILNWVVCSFFILAIDLIAQMETGIDSHLRLFLIGLFLIILNSFTKDLGFYDRPTISYLKITSKEKIFLYNSLN